VKAILWDMDGTLVDTEPRWGEATYAMAAAMGRELTPEVREKTIGGTADGTVRLCARWAGLELTGAEVSSWIDRLYDDVSVRFARGLELRPGVAGLLEAGKAAGLPMMVVTNTFRRLTDQALASIGAGYFVGSVCGDEVAVGKPDPTPYLTAADRLGLAPDDCLVFEDSVNGRASATAAGCRVVDVTAPGGLAGLDLSDVVRMWDARARVTE
jgi:HAD superfamily hydrolase (TIGR01509 family)